jgi:hypothetical protein
MRLSKGRPALLAALLVLSAAQAVQAEPANKKIALRGPSSVIEGESAVFYSRTAGAPWSLHFRARQGKQIVEFQDSSALSPGEWEISLDTPGFEASKRTVRVLPAPPRVDSTLPIAKRIAAIQVFVWDADRSTLGRVVEVLGGKLGPSIARKVYPVTWSFAGRQATSANVDHAIEELASRGYVIDLFTAVHGYPIQLADGSWGGMSNVAGFQRVRLHYTTSCHGADGMHDFLDAGVHSYIGSRDINFVNSFHMALFFKHWAKGEPAQKCCDKAFAPLKSIVSFAPIRYFVIKGLKGWENVDKSNYQQVAVEGTRPIVMGDPLVTIKWDFPASLGIALLGSEPPR